MSSPSCVRPGRKRQMVSQDQIDALRRKPVPYRPLFVGGRWVEAEGGATLPAISPLDGRELTSIADAGAADVDRAVRAARASFDGGRWSRAAPAERKKVLFR